MRNLPFEGLKGVGVYPGVPYSVSDYVFEPMEPQDTYLLKTEDILPWPFMLMVSFKRNNSLTQYCVFNQEEKVWYDYADNIADAIGNAMIRKV